MDSTAPAQFLALPPCTPAEADIVILPLPFEATVSYGTGTARGPQAILEASRQVELFDEETLVDFSVSPRIHTLPPLAGPISDPAAQASSAGRAAEAAALADDVERYLAAARLQSARFRDKFVLALGGEHTVTYGIVGGLVDDLHEVTVVQIDAHGDLLDELHGRRWSHGTVMRRLWERGCRLVQIGIRSVARSEYELATADDRIVTHFAHQLANWPEVLAGLARLQGKVYLTIDVDGLDPSVIPSTGTPQPNGLSWCQTLDVIRTLSAAPGCQLIGADIVEFVPSLQAPGCDPIAARLAAKLIAFWHSSRKGT